jgi:capsular polysaccharide biosynthesis protein
LGLSSEPHESSVAKHDNPDEASQSLAVVVLKKRWPLILIVAVVVAVATYFVARLVPAQYKSTASVVVQVSGSNPDQTATAANSVAGQYAQDVTAQVVIAGASRKLSAADAHGLSSAVSGGTVASQNIVQVSATGSSAGQAQQRAAALLAGLTEYVHRLVVGQTKAYAHAAQAQLTPIVSQIDRITSELDKAPTSKLTSGRYLALQSTLSTLIAERASANVAIAQNATAGEPSVTLLSEAGPGSQVAPRPTLYAGVAFLLALIVMWQLLLALAPRPR